MTTSSRSPRPLHRTLGWLLSATVALNGCSTMKLPEHPVQPANYSPYSQIKDGLAVAIEPLTSSQESEKYFGTDLLSAGILAVFVTAENRGAPSSFLVTKEQFSLREGQAEVHEASRRDQLGSEAAGQTINTVGALGLVIVPILALPLVFVGSKMTSDATVVKQNFAVKELQAKTLSSGEEIHGFVYFQLLPGHTGPGQWTVHLEAQDLNTKEVKSFDFTFEWRKG